MSDAISDLYDPDLDIDLKKEEQRLANFKNDVIEIVKEDDKAILTIRKEDGDIIEKKVYGEAIGDFTVPGRYDVESEKRKTKEGKTYWAITAATLLTRANKDYGGGADGDSNDSVKTPSQDRRSSQSNASDDVYRNDAITSQVAIKAAADITVAAISKATSPVDAETAKVYVCKIAEGLIESSAIIHSKKEIG